MFCRVFGGLLLLNLEEYNDWRNNRLTMTGNGVTMPRFPLARRGRQAMVFLELCVCLAVYAYD